jgi:dCTP deaminase
MLTGPEIIKALHQNKIIISPFDEKNLSSNSYDVRLHPVLKIYDLPACSGVLDVKKPNPAIDITIPDEGLILEPGILYIGSTCETAVSDSYIPMFEGRSSMGRLGINTHITAGFGDIGWGYITQPDGSLVCTYPTWTLEIAVVHPVRIYKNIRIGQVFFMEPKGTIQLYTGKYSTQRGPQTSKSYEDFKGDAVHG